MPKWRFVKYLALCGPVFHLSLLLSKCHSRGGRVLCHPLRRIVAGNCPLTATDDIF